MANKKRKPKKEAKFQAEKDIRKHYFKPADQDVAHPDSNGIYKLPDDTQFPDMSGIY